MVKILTYFILGTAIIAGGPARTDTLTLQYCYEAAKSLSPLKQQEIYNKNIHELSLKNHASNYLPQLFLNGKATYQSEVFTIPGIGMVSDIPEIPKDQYQASVNLTQNIYDAGLTRYSRQVEDSKLEVSGKELETELYDIQSTINQLFFSSLQLQESLHILQTTLENLTNQKKIVSASVEHGVVKRSSLYSIDKQILTLQQEKITLESEKEALLQMLSEWTGEPIDKTTFLKIPDLKPAPATELNIERPEISLFNARKQLLESQASMTNVRRLPRLQAFGQAGIGRPNPFNFFEIEASTFYIVGLQLNWQIYDWGNARRKKQLIGFQQNIISTREDNFKRNISIALTRQYADIEKLEAILEKDEEIIALQDRIVKTAFSELNNGVITSTDYITELNALTRARIKQALHRLELSKTYVTIYTTTGNDF